MQDILLGKNLDYPDKYSPKILYKIERDFARKNLNNINSNFFGFDIWNCYELSWLSKNGIPEVRVMEFILDCNSKYIVESKSLKMYLFSFNNTKFESENHVIQTIKKDLSDLLETSIIIKIYKLKDVINKKLSNFENSISIDSQNFEYDYTQEPSSSIIKLGSKIITENLYSDLLKSNCLITSQPDWASINIEYTGIEINKESLLKYILSYRNHNEFHEHCVERIFFDIMEVCNPSNLTVYARYTRRGGIDINPIRSLQKMEISKITNERFTRQ